MLRLVLVGSVAVLTILMAVACGGGDSPTSTVARDSSGSSEVTAVPTSTVARDSSGSSEVTAVPTSTVARDSSGSSEVAEPPSTSSVNLDEYIRNVCGETVTEVGSWEEGDSLRELS